MKRRSTIIAVVIMLAVGFATVSTTLMLNGVVGLGESDDFKIIFTSASIDGTKRNDVISESKTEISYETKVLSLIDEESTLEYEATNTSRNYDADVRIVCNIVDEDSNVIEGGNEYVDMTYTPESMSLASGETKQGSITARLKKSVTEPMDINIKCSLTGTANERDVLGEEPSDPNKLGGTLMAIFEKYSYNTLSQKKIWNEDIRIKVKKIVFENTMVEHQTSEDLVFDISDKQDGSVMAYVVPNEEDTRKYTLYINSDGKVMANSYSRRLFNQFTSLTEIEHFENFDTRNMTDAECMFYDCTSLTFLDLSNFDTSNVTNMSSMFQGCSSLTNLDLNNFDTRNVTDMQYMFDDCNSLTSLDLRSFNTSNVEDISDMFQDCSSLTNLDLSNFDISKADDISYMFYGCSKLANLDISNFNINDTAKDAAPGVFCEMPDFAIVKVKDKTTQDWIIAESVIRPAGWTTENVVIKEA